MPLATVPLPSPDFGSDPMVRDFEISVHKAKASIALRESIEEARSCAHDCQIAHSY